MVPRDTEGLMGVGAVEGGQRWGSLIGLDVSLVLIFHILQRFFTLFFTWEGKQQN